MTADEFFAQTVADAVKEAIAPLVARIDTLERLLTATGGERSSGNSGGASVDGVGDCGGRSAVAARGLDRRGDGMTKKPFELGADVERALDEIICINDDLPAEYLEEVERRRGGNDDRS